MWCIPPKQNASFVAAMEHVLGVYRLEYDPLFPVICMDEQHKQLIEEVQTPLAMAPGQDALVDYEYVRRGACVVWMMCEPLAGWREVAVTETRTARDWAHRIQALVDHPRYAMAEKITLVCDNLNTHAWSSLYATFPPNEAERICRRFDFAFTPKHGSWLNMAECELSALTRQCLSRRISEMLEVDRESTHWATYRNEAETKIDWQFRTEDARIKLKSLYPKIIT